MWAGRLRQRLRARERCKAPPDHQLIPARAVLIEQQDRSAARIDTSAEARALNFHQPHKPVNLRLIWRKLGQDAAKPQSFLAELRAHPIFAGGRGIAFVEYEIEH